MRTPLHPVIQWLLTAAFFAWSTILFIVIIGEDSPEMPYTLFNFFLIKAMAVGSAYATYKAAAWCYNREYFPALIYKYIEECKKMEDEEL